MADNKIELADGTVLIDLTEDTVTPQTMMRGTTAHDASGELVTGVVDLAYAGDANPLQDGTASPGVSDNYSREDHVHPTDPSIAAKYTKPATGIPFTDLADDAKMVVLYYGKSTWADFEAVYNTNRVVYCRASSNSNPASGSQTRMAFMAYVNNEASPTEVEFQYYRSVASHTDSQQGDQVFVYKLNKNSGWSVTTRSAFTKIATGTGLSHTYSSGTLTITNTETVPGVVSKTADGLAPQLPDETTTTKFLRQDASWAEPVVTTVNGHTVQSDVPANAVFTDTTYSDATTSASGLMSAADKTKLNGLSSDAATVNGHTVASDVPANAVFTDTHRPIQVDGTQILGSNTTPLNLVAGTNVTLTNSGGAVTIDASGGSGGSNPNLLNNWWFGEGLFHPSGQSPITADGYSGGLNIFGDAWHLRMGTVTKITTGSGDDSFTCWEIQFGMGGGNPFGGGSSSPGQFIQFLQNPLPPYPNGPYTLSVIAAPASGAQCMLGLFIDDQFTYGIPIYGSSGFRLFQYTFDALPSFASHTIAVGLQTYPGGGYQQAVVDILAMKLEVGYESTLAHLDANDNWVLNDSPDNKLPLYGGIITGRLRIQTTKSDSLGKNVLTLQNMNTSRSTTPSSSDVLPLRIGFYDQNTNPYGWVGSEHLTSGKYGLHMTAAGPSASNSLRLLVDSSNNCTVEVSDSAAWRAALGVPATGDVVAKAGDTMTGSLISEMSGSASLIIKDTSADTTSRSTNKNTSYIVFRDKNNVGVASMRASVLTNGYNSLFLQASAGNYVNNLKLHVDSSGNRAVEVTDAAIWRDALSFVDLSSAQTVAGVKTFTSNAVIDISGTKCTADTAYPILKFKYQNPQSQVKEVQVIRTYGDSETTANNGCVLMGSNSGNTIITAGESATTVVKNKGISNGESAYVIADSGIYLWTNANTAANVVEAVNIAANGTVTLASALPVASGGTGATTAAEANAALGAKYWKNSSAITSSQSRTLTFSAAVRCVLYLVNTVTGNSGEYLVYCGSATSTPVITTVKAASNVTLTAAAGKITFTSTHASNQYVYAMNLTNNPGSMTFA